MGVGGYSVCGGEQEGVESVTFAKRQSELGYRRPVSVWPVESFDLVHPMVPRGNREVGGLDGLKILHLSDLHVRRKRLETDGIQGILRALEATPVDVIALTGDLMDEPGHEAETVEVLSAMAHVWRARLGAFCVLGNHDTPELKRRMERELPRVQMVGNQIRDVSVGGGEVLRIIGLDWPEDPLGVMLNAGVMGGEVGSEAGGGVLPLVLAHHPTSLVPVAQMGFPLMLAGHTHAGQVRLHARHAPHTSSDLPADLATGMLRLHKTICCISRGLGDGVVEHLRINCPRQMPMYTLKHGELMDPPRGGSTRVVTQVRAW